jgi:two-component system, chemotaxis family, response regulator Rcp1
MSRARAIFLTNAVSESGENPNWAGAPPFYLRFPVGAPLNDESAEAGDSPRPVSILLVEDNPSDVFIIREALRGAGFPIDLQTAANGEEALSRLRSLDREPPSKRPALILLDWNLPRISGAEVLAYIRQSATWKDVPVVIVTSTSAPAEVAEMSRLGANAHFRKPSDLDSYLLLAKIILTTLGRSGVG